MNQLTDDDVRALSGKSPRLSGGDNVYRDVFDLGTHVLKVDRAQRKGNSAKEVKIWERHKDLPGGVFLAPITAYGTLPNGRTWLVMEKAETLDDVEQEWLEVVMYECLIDDYGAEPAPTEFAEEWSDLLRFVERCSLVDVHYQNVGRIGGRPVIIDYAGYS